MLSVAVAFKGLVIYTIGMHIAEKEHLLHKILAGSAFAFALALLPIAHYFYQNPTVSNETGSVAGASTSRPLADVGATSAPNTPEQCLLAQTKALSDLQKLSDTWLRNYDDQVTASNGDQAQLALISEKYQKELLAVESQKNVLESSSCPAE